MNVILSTHVNLDEFGTGGTWRCAGSRGDQRTKHRGSFGGTKKWDWTSAGMGTVVEGLLVLRKSDMLVSGDHIEIIVTDQQVADNFSLEATEPSFSVCKEMFDSIVADIGCTVEFTYNDVDFSAVTYKEV